MACCERGEAICTWVSAMSCYPHALVSTGMGVDGLLPQLEVGPAMHSTTFSSMAGWLAGVCGHHWLHALAVRFAAAVLEGDFRGVISAFLNRCYILRDAGIGVMCAFDGEAFPGKQVSSHREASRAAALAGQFHFCFVTSAFIDVKNASPTEPQPPAPQPRKRRPPAPWGRGPAPLAACGMLQQAR